MKLRDGLAYTRELLFPSPNEVYQKRNYPTFESSSGCLRPIEFEDKALAMAIFRWSLSVSIIGLLTFSAIKTVVDNYASDHYLDPVKTTNSVGTSVVDNSIHNRTNQK